MQLGSARRVEPDLLRPAADARLFLFRNDEWHRLKAMRDKYAALLPFVNHRNDLTYLLGELIGVIEQRSYLCGRWERPAHHGLNSDYPRRRVLPVPPVTHVYRIDRICPVENLGQTHSFRRSRPLGLNIKPGDYILSINGTPVSPCLISRCAHRHSGQTVILTVNSKPSPEGARDVTVVPNRR